LNDEEKIIWFLFIHFSFTNWDQSEAYNEFIAFQPIDKVKD